MSIGQEIKEYRKMTRLTQQAFGRLMEVSGPTVSRWEKGIDEPTKENLAKIQEIIDNPPPWADSIQQDELTRLEAENKKLRFEVWELREEVRNTRIALTELRCDFNELAWEVLRMNMARLRKEIKAMNGGE